MGVIIQGARWLPFLHGKCSVSLNLGCGFGVQKESVEDRNFSPAETGMNQREKVGEMEFKNLSFKSSFSLRHSRGCRQFCGWCWMFSNAEETASCRGIFLRSVKWEKRYLLKWSSDWEPPSWMMFAWRKVKEKHGASWAVVVTLNLTKSLSCLKPWIRNLWLARKTQWFFFLGLSLFCDFKVF